MSPIPAALDYTGLDQIDLEERTIRLMEQLWPEWEEKERAALGNLHIRLMATVGDRVSFYQDNQARESRMTTAQLRVSILSFAKMLGYRPSSARPATTDVTLTMPALAGDVVLPAGTKVLTAEVTQPTVYQLTETVTILAGETSVSASAEHSETRTETFASTGLANQILRTRYSPFIDGTLTVVAADGTYTEVTDLLDSVSTDRHFTVRPDDRDRAVFRFGNGVLGRIPTGTITAIYRTGGGTAGRVEANRLTRLQGSFFDTFGTPARISVTNPDASTPGADRESNAEVKVNAPRSLRTVQRALVAREDYEIAAEQVPGVARALHLPDVVGVNQGLVLVVPDDLGVASPTLIAQVEAKWGPGGPYKKLNSYQISGVAGVYLELDISAIVALAAGISRPVARASVVASLAALFALTVPDPATGELVRNERINFGYYFRDAQGNVAAQFPWSDVFNAVRDATGIRYVDPGPSGLLLNDARDNVALEARQFPKLGTVTLIDAADGTPF